MIIESLGGVLSRDTWRLTVASDNESDERQPCFADLEFLSDLTVCWRGNKTVVLRFHKARLELHGNLCRLNAANPSELVTILVEQGAACDAPAHFMVYRPLKGCPGKPASTGEVP